jgi:hypothetical protein
MAMTSKSATKKDLIKLEENLGRIIAKGFNENTEQHQKIFGHLDRIEMRLDRIEIKLEGIVY